MEPEALAQRIGRIEGSNRRFLATAGLLAIGFLALICSGAGREKSRTIDVERILLRDRSGELQAELRACTGESGFALFDAKGNERLRLGCSGDGSTTLSIAASADRISNRRNCLRAGSDGWSTLSFSDAEGERLTLGLAYDGEPRLTMFTRDHKPRVSLGSDTSGGAELVIHDVSGDARGVLRAAPDGSPTLKLYGGEGHAVFSAPRP